MHTPLFASRTGCRLYPCSSASDGEPQPQCDVTSALCCSSNASISPKWIGSFDNMLNINMHNVELTSPSQPVGIPSSLSHAIGTHIVPWHCGYDPIVIALKPSSSV